MKNPVFALTGLLLVFCSVRSRAQNGSESLYAPELPNASVESSKNWIRSENELAESALAQLPFDAFLSQSGYVVFPVEENVATLQSMISKNPMVLHKEYIPRRVRVLRRVDGHSSDGTVHGVLGKRFAVVSEIGSVSQFMVDEKDLHFVERQDEASNASK